MQIVLQLRFSTTGLTETRCPTLRCMVELPSCTSPWEWACPLCTMRQRGIFPLLRPLCMMRKRATFLLHLQWCTMKRRGIFLLHHLLCMTKRLEISLLRLHWNMMTKQVSFLPLRHPLRKLIPQLLLHKSQLLLHKSQLLLHKSQPLQQPLQQPLPLPPSTTTSTTSPSSPRKTSYSLFSPLP